MMTKRENKKTKSGTNGQLFIVASPIGNQTDWTERAKTILQEADVIAAEDTRILKRELAKVGIKPKKVVTCHNHNEQASSKGLIEILKSGSNVAYVSDAGTPIISDPGFHLVRTAFENSIKVVPVPGPSSLTCALSVAGIPGNCFYFGGFLPPQSEARKSKLEKLKNLGDTLVFYEAPHRIREFIADALEVLGGQTSTTVCRELTKPYEEVITGRLLEISAHLASSEPRGEFVVIFQGSPPVLMTAPDTEKAVQNLLENGRTASDILEELQLLTEMNRRQLYDTITRLKNKEII